MPPLDIIMTQSVGPEIRKDGFKRLILSGTCTCPGLAQKARGPGSSPGPG